MYLNFLYSENVLILNVSLFLVYICTKYIYLIGNVSISIKHCMATYFIYVAGPILYSVTQSDNLLLRLNNIIKSCEKDNSKFEILTNG